MVSRSLVFVMVALLVLALAEATYRKPPFNGSIFGKRANQAVSEFEEAAGARKALSSLCEVVAESCSAWFPNSESSV
ncbi:SIFamide-related peptide [Macrosteles quadrilineatus]|uniref:SIFamide-related peptide n=1 Tax=Macrosteles quadrilineatus TaxID=74068 RepID=UPI0023E13023|nr:SIFamide-related peptide [Macrosteles quadrilineatus]